MRGVSGANVGGLVGPCKKLPSNGSTVGVGVMTRVGTRVGARVGRTDAGALGRADGGAGSTLFGVLVVGPIGAGVAVTGASLRSGGGAIALQTSTSGQNAAPRESFVKLDGGMSSGLLHNSPNGNRQ